MKNSPIGNETVKPCWEWAPLESRKDGSGEEATRDMAYAEFIFFEWVCT